MVPVLARISPQNKFGALCPALGYGLPHVGGNSGMQCFKRGSGVTQEMVYSVGLYQIITLYTSVRISEVCLVSLKAGERQTRAIK